jgi:hypothetical protein
MTSRESKRRWRIVRRRRRVGRMTPAEATALGKRPRRKGWVYTKQGTWRHRYENHHYFEAL